MPAPALVASQPPDVPEFKVFKATCHLKSQSEYSPSRRTGDEGNKGDSGAAKDAHSRANYRAHLWVNKDGQVYIPPLCFKKALDSAAKQLNLKIPGYSPQTFGATFRACVSVLEPLVLDYKKDDKRIRAEEFFASPQRTGKQMLRVFPVIPAWSGKVVFFIKSSKITPAWFEYHLNYAGWNIGIGRWRAEVGGPLGTWQIVEAPSWEQVV